MSKRELKRLSVSQNVKEWAKTSKCKQKRQSASQNVKAWAETSKREPQRQSARRNVKVQAEISKHKLKCLSAEVQTEILSPSMFKDQNASWVVKMRVERSKRELNGQHVRWTV